MQRIKFTTGAFPPLFKASVNPTQSIVAPSLPHRERCTSPCLKSGKIFIFTSCSSEHPPTHSLTCRGWSWGWLVRWYVLPYPGAAWIKHTLLLLWAEGTQQGNWARENSSLCCTWEEILDLKVKGHRTICQTPGLPGNQTQRKGRWHWARAGHRNHESQGRAWDLFKICPEMPHLWSAQAS